jgi:hypothetical protein
MALRVLGDESFDVFQQNCVPAKPRR